MKPYTFSPDFSFKVSKTLLEAIQIYSLGPRVVNVLSANSTITRRHIFAICSNKICFFLYSICLLKNYPTCGQGFCSVKDFIDSVLYTHSQYGHTQKEVQQIL